MSETESRNDIEEKRGTLQRRGWIEIADAREDGLFIMYNFANSSSSALFYGVISEMDQYGSFLVWDPSRFESKIDEDSEQAVNAQALGLRKKGWEVRTGLVKKDEIAVWSLVAVKEREKQIRHSSPPGGSRTKGVPCLTAR